MISDFKENAKLNASFCFLTNTLFPLIYLFLERVMVTSVLADRHPGELHIFRNYDPPSIPRVPPYATTATFKPLTIPEGKLLIVFIGLLHQLSNVAIERVWSVLKLPLGGIKTSSFQILHLIKSGYHKIKTSSQHIQEIKPENKGSGLM